MTPNLTPATFDDWLAGLDVRPPDQRPGQWAVNTLTPELWTAVNGTPFDAYYINGRLPKLIRYARQWWGVMEVSREIGGIDMSYIPGCMWMAVKRGQVPGDDEDCALALVTEPGAVEARVWWEDSDSDRVIQHDWFTHVNAQPNQTKEGP